MILRGYLNALGGGVSRTTGTSELNLVLVKQNPMYSRVEAL
jgi:hypothetical protein